MTLSSRHPAGGPALAPKRKNPLSASRPPLPVRVPERLARTSEWPVSRQAGGSCFSCGHFPWKILLWAHPLPCSGASDTGKMPGGGGKAASLETFLTPGRASRLSSEEFRALQTRSSCPGTVDRPPVLDQRVARPAEGLALALTGHRAGRAAAGRQEGRDLGSAQGGAAVPVGGGQR